MSLGLLTKLSRLSAIYVLGDVVAKGAAFLLLPLYTRFLSPDDYGIIGLSEMIKQVLMTLLSLGTTGAVLRFYFQIDDPAERRRFYGTLWLLLITLPGLACLALLAAGRPLFAGLFASVPFDPYIRTALLITFLNTAFTLLPPLLFRAREQAWRYTAFTLSLFLLTQLLIIWEVVLRGRGAAGYLEAQLLAAAVMAVVSAALLLREVDLRPAWRYIGPLLAYSLPLMPHFLAHWALNLSDRAIIERFATLDQLGIYTLAFQFAAIAQLVVNALNNALLPMFSRAARSDEEARRLPQALTYYLLAVALLVPAISLAAGNLIRLATPAAYHQAGDLTIWLVGGSMALALYYLPVNNLAQTAGRTRALPLTTGVAAACNIGLNLLFVPRFGALAAAINTLIGYTLLFVLVYAVSQRQRPVPYEYARIGKILLAGLAALALGRLLLRFDPLVNLLLVPPVLLLIPLLLFPLGFYTQRERELIGDVASRLAARLKIRPCK